MEFTCTVKYTVEAESFEDAEIQAKTKLINNNIDFVNDNLEVECTDPVIDEYLILKSYVKISSYREKVIEALKTAGVNGLTPTEIAEECGILVNHISKVLKELRDKDLIQCINPRVRKGRIYRLTATGELIGGLL